MIVATIVLADAFSITGLIIWLIVGLIANRLMGFSSFGLRVVGLIGAFIGGLLANLLIPGATNSLIGSIIVAFIGACILIWFVRLITGGRRPMVTKLKSGKIGQSYRTQGNTINSLSDITSMINTGPIGVPSVEGNKGGKGLEEKAERG
ncbi:MAG: GlsB/YeaQ/YmgE family stress response membrane protein [Ktedonobacteraceae bacterium]